MEKRNRQIALNVMYAGYYLKVGNLGHEVINMYRADDDKNSNKGGNHLYLQPYGTFGKERKGKVWCVLHVRNVGDNTVEVIAKAEGLKEIYDPEHGAKDIKNTQSSFITSNKIKYGGVDLTKIFSENTYGDDSNKEKDENTIDNKTDQSIFITYTAEKVIKPKLPIFIKFDDGKTKSDENKEDNSNFHIVKLNSYNKGKQTLKQYISYEDKHERDYNTIEKIINGDYWEGELEKVNVTNISTFPHTMFDICGIEYSELAYSNALAYFLREDHNFANCFVKDVLGIKEGLSKDYSVLREFHNIDIYIKDETKQIILENKLKSGINGVYKEEKGGKDSQLERYIDVLIENIVEHNLKGIEGKPSKELKPKKNSDKHNNYIKHLTNTIIELISIKQCNECKIELNIDTLKAAIQNTKLRELTDDILGNIILEIINIKPYLLSPNYNQIKIKNYYNYSTPEYKEILYSALYKFMKEQPAYNDCTDFKIFTDALKRHTETYDNPLYDKMNKLFVQRLNRLSKKQ